MHDGQNMTKESWEEGSFMRMKIECADKGLKGIMEQGGLNWSW